MNFIVIPFCRTFPFYVGKAVLYSFFYMTSPNEHDICHFVPDNCYRLLYTFLCNKYLYSNYIRAPSLSFFSLDNYIVLCKVVVPCYKPFELDLGRYCCILSIHYRICNVTCVVTSTLIL